MVGELSQEFLRSQRAAKLAEKMCQCYDLCQALVYVKSFPRQSRSRGGGIATVYKSTLGSNITFKTNFDFTHTRSK